MKFPQKSFLGNENKLSGQGSVVSTQMSRLEKGFIPTYKLEIYLFTHNQRK